MEELLKMLPPWLGEPLLLVVKILVVVMSSVGALALLIKSVAQIKKTVTDEFLPIRFKPDHRRRAHHRRRFAEHLYDELRRLDTEQQWSDHRFTELEAHVEAEGKRSTWLPRALQRAPTGIRLAKSLTEAIDRSRERLILVEGEPGSGKSVALRHLARNLATRAKAKPNLTLPIPLYFNLKELHRAEGERIDGNMIEAFALRSLNRANDRDVAEFLEEEFKRGKEQGTWIFLFDSFDEIPDILAAVESDATIAAYTQAIADFLSGLNECRGVVASRYFRGPGQVSWPRFKILALDEKRRSTLIERAELKPEIEEQVLGRLSLASTQFGPLSSNPMFVGLLCEHMRSGLPFPDNLHAVFEGYIRSRFHRDAERIRQRYGLEIEALREAAETVAFCMAAENSLGISASRERIKTALCAQAIEVPTDLEARLDALEFLKLARSESESSGTRLFTFAHRRFQEYFATCVVLRAPDRVSPHALLLDGRWRETATVICQTAPTETLAPLLAECRQFLERVREADDYKPEVLTDGTPAPRTEFSWPPGLLHVLNLLQEGFRGRLAVLPEDIRKRVGNVVTRVTDRATIAHRKWVLEVAGAAPEPVLLSALRSAYESNSQWLMQVAYWQVGRLPYIPDDIARRILEALVLHRRLWRDRHATRAHLSRLNPNTQFMHALRLLLAIPFIDLVALVLGVLLLDQVVLQWNEKIAQYVEALPFRPTWPRPLVWPGVTGGLVVALLVWWAPLVSARLAVESLWVGNQRSKPPAWLQRLHQVLSRDSKPNAAKAVAKRRAAQGEVIYMTFVGAAFVRLTLAAHLLDGARAAQSASMDQDANDMSPFLLVCMASWILAWAPLAYLAANRGRFVFVAWWPILPVWPVLYALQNGPKALDWVIKRWKWILIASVLCFICAGALAAIISSLAAFDAIGNFMDMVISGRMFALLATGWITGWMFLKWIDFRTLRALSVELPAELNAERFLAILGSLRLNSGRAAFLRMVKSKNALTPAHAGAVIALAAAIEGIQADGISHEFERWHAEHKVQKRIALAQWSSEVLDEILALRESLQAAELRASNFPVPAHEHPSPSPGLGIPGT